MRIKNIQLHNFGSYCGHNGFNFEANSSFFFPTFWFSSWRVNILRANDSTSSCETEEMFVDSEFI